MSEEKKETAEEKAERLHKEYMVTWRRTVQDDLSSNKNFVGRVCALVEILNMEGNLKLVLLETPPLRFGPYTPGPRLVEVYLVYNLKKAVPTVPDEVRKEFLRLVINLEEGFKVMEYKIGFKPHMGGCDVRNIVEPLLPDKCVHDCPMLKIVVAI